MTSPDRLSPAEARARCASGSHHGPTSGIAPGFVQANLAILPSAASTDFATFCARNPAPCPLLEQLPAGSPHPIRLAQGADLRRDLPRYRCYRADGTITEQADIESEWRADAVAFLLGCSFTFEAALAAVGLPPRHWEHGGNVPMYRTVVPTTGAGPFRGPLVVSMRPIPRDRVAEVARITASYPLAHGAPVHHGDPEVLGIGDLRRPEWGHPVEVRRGEVPVFWACGVTSQVAIVAALAAGAIPWAITHTPGHMFITDQPEPGSTLR